MLIPATAGAWHQREGPNLIPDVLFERPDPDTLVTLDVGVWDIGFGPSDVPPVDVVVWMDGVLLAEFRTPAFGFEYYQPVDWFATAGLHTIVITVDASDEVEEEHEADNTITFTFDVTTGRPDLAIEDLVVNVDRDAHRADGSFLLCNRGEVVTFEPQLDYEPKDEARLQYRAKGAATWQFLAFHRITPLAPGACETFTFSWSRDIVTGSLEFRAQTICYWCGETDTTNDEQTVTAGFFGSEYGFPTIAWNLPRA